MAARWLELDGAYPPPGLCIGLLSWYVGWPTQLDPVLCELALGFKLPGARVNLVWRVICFALEVERNYVTVLPESNDLCICETTKGLFSL